MLLAKKLQKPRASCPTAQALIDPSCHCWEIIIQQYSACFCENTEHRYVLKTRTRAQFSMDVKTQPRAKLQAELHDE